MSGKVFDDDGHGRVRQDHRPRRHFHARQVGIHPETVTCRIVVALVEEGVNLPVLTDLRYDSAEPHSVLMVFNADTDMTVEWEFGRELLVSGLQGLSGIGDVQIWYSEILGYGLLYLSFRSGEEKFLIAASAVVVDEFLERTFEVVPQGKEECFLHTEDRVGRLLGET
ncbi:SsgA family sporulation/cell division regulator [Streptomyces sp. NPDC048665]|uniref:SsgA family sporulation/cell division regulator n=1 Tax=Streptomyces sp. NPDC048665 TaxID=3155490 RepID=UPI0034165950